MLGIDCGNSRIKWGRAEDGMLAPRAAGPLNDEATFAALGAALDSSIDRVLIANVAGPEVGRRLAALVESRLGVAAEFVRAEAAAHGIECAYRDPATLGVDRWLALIAARRRATGAFAVIGAGTAVTFDAVDAGGRHLGGLILPGDGLMIDALARGTAQIDPVPRAGRPVTGLDLLGRSTAEAVARGSRLALAAALDRAAGIVAEALGGAVQVYVTGGDADLIAPWLETGHQVSADLVLEGLAAVAAAPESL